MAKIALVIGANGQDGTYLVRHLMLAGWSVHGLGRQPVARETDLGPGFVYHSIDLADLNRLADLLKVIRPDVVFHFAAIHGASGFLYEDHWRDVHAVNVISVHCILEYLRCNSPETPLIYASSSKVFGADLPAVISESSPRYSECIYTITKNAATDLIAYYRKRYSLKTSVVWTFNHESPQRGAAYFLPKIVDTLAKAVFDPAYQAEIATLGFWADWGDADEYMGIVTNADVAFSGQDFVLATGRTVWAEDFVDAFFRQFGFRWQTHLQQKFPATGDRPFPWRADIGLIEHLCGRRPLKQVEDIALDMLKTNYPDAWHQLSADSLAHSG